MFEAEEEGAGVFDVLSKIAWIRQSDPEALTAMNRRTADVFIRSSCECKSRESASADRILRFKRPRTRSRSIAAMSCGEALMTALRAMTAQLTRNRDHYSLYLASCLKHKRAREPLSRG